MKLVFSLSVLISLVYVTSLFAQVDRWIRFDDSGIARYGKIEGDIVRVIDGQPWDKHSQSSRTLAISDVQPLIPTDPQIVLGAAYNYRSHLGDRKAPTEPQFFLKTRQCLIANGEPIQLPRGADNAHYEAELVIVIGRTVENATLEEANNAIFGFTCGNDISERTWQEIDVQWWRAKASRTFGPVGPVIVTGLDWKTLRVRGLLNGETVQDESAADMLFSPPELIQFASQFVILHPGDLVFTASPGKTQSLQSGDTYEVRIEGVGHLSNPVTTGPASTAR